MKKINVIVIVRDHLSTLRDDRGNVRSWADVAFFYILPILLGTSYYFCPFALPVGIENNLIAVFSVFGALLFSAQISLYGLSPKKPETTGDSVTDERNFNDFKNEKKFFREVNFNVSYLILISCISLILFLVTMIANVPQRFEGSALVILMSHFFLTLLMLIKRSHVAFSIRHSD